MMVDPVIAADGHTYERTAIQDWLQGSSLSPVTKDKLSHTRLFPNVLVKSALAQHAQGGLSYGPDAASVAHDCTFPSKPEPLVSPPSDLAPLTFEGVHCVRQACMFVHLTSTTWNLNA